MKKRLSEKMTIVLATGIMAMNTLNPYAIAVGSSEKAKMVESREVVYQVSHQPAKNENSKIEDLIKLDNAAVVQQLSTFKIQKLSLSEKQIDLQAELLAQKQAEEEALQKQEEVKANTEAKIQQDRFTFTRMVKQKDVTRINLKTPSGLIPDDIEKILTDTKLAGLGQAFADAESKHGVNAYYLMAHAVWESAWGESRLANNKNNLFGFSAYDSSAYNSAKKFSTKADCIDTVAAYISEHYLDENGDHYNGPNLKGMNKKYASDQEWANGIASVIRTLVKKNSIQQTL